MIEALVKRIFEIAVTEGHPLAEDAQDLLVEPDDCRDAGACPTGLRHRRGATARAELLTLLHLITLGAA